MITAICFFIIPLIIIIGGVISFNSADLPTKKNGRALILTGVILFGIMFLIGFPIFLVYAACSGQH